MEVPEVLLSGDHAAIARWRLDRRIERTRDRRPDLLGEAGE
jgi:tRNA (guanine37-N1)-methyltransferase